MTRTGKIARLPRQVRDELNRRLRDGQKGSQLAAWLNALPKVLSILRPAQNRSNRIKPNPKKSKQIKVDQSKSKQIKALFFLKTAFNSLAWNHPSSPLASVALAKEARPPSPLRPSTLDSRPSTLDHRPSPLREESTPPRIGSPAFSPTHFLELPKNTSYTATLRFVAGLFRRL